MKNNLIKINDNFYICFNQDGYKEYKSKYIYTHITNKDPEYYPCLVCYTDNMNQNMLYLYEKDIDMALKNIKKI